MKVLRYGAVILMIITLLMGCVSNTEGTVPKETMEESHDSQFTNALVQEEETYPILAASVSSTPTTDLEGHIGVDRDEFLTFVSICYKKDDEVLFKVLNIDNQNNGNCKVYFREGEEDKLVVMERGGEIFVPYTKIYTIYLTKENYQSIF